jgi:hypothetical protein
MKKLILFISLTFAATALSGQKSIDALFEKYAGMDGFVTVTFNGNLLKLFSESENDKGLPPNITELRILAQEDGEVNAGNFYDLAIKDVNLSDYEEFMKVRESHQDLRMLVRIEGKVFREFLLIAGGEDNAIIQIKGNMTFNDAKKFSEHSKKEHGTDIYDDKE